MNLHIFATTFGHVFALNGSKKNRGKNTVEKILYTGNITTLAIEAYRNFIAECFESGVKINVIPS